MDHVYCMNKHEVALQQLPFATTQEVTDDREEWNVECDCHVNVNVDVARVWNRYRILGVKTDLKTSTVINLCWNRTKNYSRPTKISELQRVTKRISVPVFYSAVKYAVLRWVDLSVLPGCPSHDRVIRRLYQNDHIQNQAYRRIADDSKIWPFNFYRGIAMASWLPVCPSVCL